MREKRDFGKQGTRPRGVYWLWLIIVVAGISSELWSQQYGPPVVARMKMQLKKGDAVLDTIEKGDLLTVTAEDEKAYDVITHTGIKGRIGKQFAAGLAEAVEIYDDLVAGSPTEGRYYTQRGSAWHARATIPYTKPADYERCMKRALADYQQAIKLGYEQPDAYLSLGNLQAALGKSDDAIASLNVAIEKAAKDKKIDESLYVSRAAVYESQGDFQRAVKDYDQALKLNPKRLDMYEKRAAVWSAMGELDKAISDFTLALRVDKNYSPAHMGRGFIWFLKGEHKKAVDDYSAVIRLAPDEAKIYKADAYNDRGYNRQILGDFKNALADFEAAFSLNPQHLLACQNIAMLCAAAPDDALRNGDQALKAAEQAWSLFSQKANIGALVAQAAAWAEKGDFVKAVGFQQQVVAFLSAQKELDEEGKKQLETESRVLKEYYEQEKPYRFESVPK